MDRRYDEPTLQEIEDMDDQAGVTDEDLDYAQAIVSARISILSDLGIGIDGRNLEDN